MTVIYRLASLIAVATYAIAAANAQEKPADGNAEIVVTAQQQRPQVTSGGSLGALGERPALETPFNVRNYTAQLILDQQAEALGEVLENDPSVRITQGFGNQSELFVIRGFPLSGDDVALDGLYGITPRQLVSPELYDRVQVLNDWSAFLFGAAPAGSGLGGGINLIPKRAEKTLLRATASYAGDSVWGGNIDVGTRFGADDAVGFRVNGVYRNAFASGGYRTVTGAFTATTPTNLYAPVAVPRPTNIAGTGGDLANPPPPPRVARTAFGSLFASDTIGLFGDRVLVTGGARRQQLVADDHPVTLRVGAENVDNRRYWTSAFGGYLLQGQSRTVKASITVEY